MDDFLGDEAEFGDVMDPINLKKRKFDENDTMEDEDDMNRDESMATNNELEKSSAKKTRQAEGEEDDDEEGKDEENKEEESFDISLSESEPEEEEENFDLFEKLEGQKPQSETTDVKKEEDKPNDLVKPGTSKSVEVSEKKKRLSIDNTAQEAARKKKIEQIEEENKKMQVLMANFSEEQLNRYETFRRSAFQKSSIKKIIQTVCGKSVSQSVVIAMSGISKVFVGEIVEKALDIKEKWGDAGPIQPKHLREAFRLFKNSNRLANSIKYKKSSLF